MKSVHRLLVTRFEPHAQELTDKLNKIDCFAIAQPLLTVKTLKDEETLNAFLSGTYHLVIAVSGNAVLYTEKQLQNSWPKAEYYAVGRATQSLLKEASQQNVLTSVSTFDSEGLLSLDSLKSVSGKYILILRGEGGRDLLEEVLTERGAKVDFFQTYKRINIDLDGQLLVNIWQQALINGAIISSVEILKQLFTLVPNEHKDWLLQLVLYVPSQRIAQHALRLGVKSVVLLPSIHTDQIVEFFQKNHGNFISPIA